MSGTYSHRRSFHCQGVLSQLAIVLLQHLLGIIRQDRVAVLPGVGNVPLQQLHGQRIMSFITASHVVNLHPCALVLLCVIVQTA